MSAPASVAEQAGPVAGDDGDRHTSLPFDALARPWSLAQQFLVRAHLVGVEREHVLLGERHLNKAGVQIPLAEIGQSDDGYVRATGYGSLAKGLYLCQHSADLAARVELSKLIRVKVTERSTDRIRERTGKETEQDIEIVREGLVNEVLSEVRIADRKADKDAGTCSSTAVIPKKNLGPMPVSGSDTGVSAPR